MDEYISKQKVLDYLNSYLHSLGEGGADALLFDRGQRRALINSIQDISAVKAADVQPVKHGRWIKVVGENYECSNCKAALWTRKVNPVSNYKYCWSCGAKMDSNDNG